MIKSRSEKKAVDYRLHIAFILILVLLILCFYFFPKSSLFRKVNYLHKSPTIELIEIPITIQKKITQHQLMKPDIPIPVDKIEILDSMRVSIQTESIHDSITGNDSTMLFYISSLFPELIEINEFDPQPIIESSRRIYNFKNYFAHRLTLPDTDKPHEPSSPLVDETLNRLMGRGEQMISINLIQAPLSSANIKNIKKERLTLENLLTIKKYFSLLEYLYEKPAISLVELYTVKPVNESYTFSTLSDAIDVLYQQGLVSVKRNQNIKLYSIFFTIQEMIDQINRILTTIPEKDHQNREYLYGLVNQLIAWS